MSKRDTQLVASKAEQGQPLKASVIIPAKNEAAGLAAVLARLSAATSGVDLLEVIVVDDGSDDGTADVARRGGARVVSHPYSMGNGAAIKTGVREASGDILLFMDADGQHDPAHIQTLMDRLSEGYDMVVAARERASHAGLKRWSANWVYNKLASWLVGQRIEDLTSGFRAARTKLFREFLHLLPNGFSYPTTITMAFFRAGYRVGYVPTPVYKRVGKSHINIWRDGVRFFLIIFKMATLYSPLKIFFPISIALAALGIGYSGYTLFFLNRFTNMSALLIVASLLVFLIGLVSEQITNLLYTITISDADKKIE